MKLFLFLCCVCLASGAFATVPAYEPFADSTSFGGTTYTAGSNLIGQTNSSGLNWTQAGPTPIVNQPVIQATSLSVSGLASSTGNSVKFGGNGTSARFNYGSSITSGTLYYSLALKVTDITGISGTGIFFAGFNNSTGTQTTTPSIVGSRLIAKGSGGTFQIGMSKASSVTADFQFSPTLFNPGDTIFLVGSYTYNTGTTTDDLSSLWVNPSSADFGAAVAPGGSLTSSAGTDLSALASFVLFNRNTAEPAVMFADELRIGTTWADVTPAAVPEPSTFALFGLGAVGFLFRRFRR